MKQGMYFYHYSHDIIYSVDMTNEPFSRISFIARVRPSFIGVCPFADKFPERKKLLFQNLEI
jgi:hypothetical protein